MEKQSSHVETCKYCREPNNKTSAKGGEDVVSHEGADQPSMLSLLTSEAEEKKLMIEH
jgi:hypothetical protein